jgi:hypothetical protein
MSIRLKSNIYVFCLSVILFGCGSNSTEPVNEPETRLYFTPNEVTVSKNEQADVALAISGLTESIFGLSFQMIYDSTVISFSDTQEVEVGDFMGQDVIAFIKIIESTVHMSYTRIQGQESVSGSGVICIIPLTGEAVGNCRIQVLSDEIHFYDSIGEEIEISKIELEPMQVNVR